jgi:hypothetical protein
VCSSAFSAERVSQSSVVQSPTGARLSQVRGTRRLAPSCTAVDARERAKKSYTSSGQGTYESTGQACFGAKWAGTGGWTTSYKQTITATNVGTSTDTFSGDSSYSWDEREVEGGAACAVELLKIPGDKPSGGASWNEWYVRIGTKGNDVQTFPTSPTITTPCSKAVTEPPTKFASGDIVLKSHGSSLMFEINLGLPGEDCDAAFPNGIFPGEAVSGGKVGGNFFGSTSVEVPKTAIEHARTVSITISSDPNHGGLPNCGVVSATTVSSGSSSTVKCSQTGAWQGS